MVEVPLLIKTLPESWALPSIIGAVAQLGQIGPILLYFMKCEMFSCCPTRFLNIKQKKVPDKIIIYALFTIGLASMAALAFYWDITIFFFGKIRSIPLLTGVFFLAILDCTCTIVFLTYIGKFKQNYVTALYIGEGISSLLPGLFALAQGIGEDNNCNNQTLNSTHTNTTHYNPTELQPNFSVSTYFWILFATLLVSFSAFIALDRIPYFKTHRIIRNKTDEAQTEPLRGEHKEGALKVSSTKGKYSLYLAITIVSFLLYGFIPGLSSYSALPYGSKTMHLCVALGR